VRISAQLDRLAQAAGIPLIIDNAYGEPFPNIIHKDVTLHWHENIILSMSLSKLGLPAVRTGIIVAAPEIVQAMTRMNAVINLTPGSLGPSMIAPLFDSGQITGLKSRSWHYRALTGYSIMYPPLRMLQRALSFFGPGLRICQQ